MTDQVLRSCRRVSGGCTRTWPSSIPPEQLLRALLLQALYTIRSERLLMEEIDYSVLFRWFIGLSMDDRFGRRQRSARTGRLLRRTWPVRSSTAC